MRTKIYGYLGVIFESLSFVFMGMAIAFAFYLPEHKHIMIYFASALVSMTLFKVFRSLYEINDEEEYKKALKDLRRDLRNYNKKEEVEENAR